MVYTSGRADSTGTGKRTGGRSMYAAERTRNATAPARKTRTRNATTPARKTRTRNATAPARKTRTGNATAPAAGT